MRASGYDIAVLPGDGIGPEVTEAAIEVLEAVLSKLRVRLNYRSYEGGASTYRETGEGISVATMTAIGRADAILLGAMGLPDVRKPDGTEIAPQIDIREHYHLFASLRPCTLLPGVPPVLRDGTINMLIIREITEGLFAGRNDPRSLEKNSESDRMTITRETSEQLFEVAFAQAKLRRQAGGRGHVTLLDKANVLKSMAFFRSVFDQVADRHHEIETSRLYVDAAAMMMVHRPQHFDVVVTENMLGDIISELAAGLAGGLGLAPSVDIGANHAVFQPCHGTAPDIAGQNLANPVGAILSAAMLLDWLAQRNGDGRCSQGAELVRRAVSSALGDGVRTSDVGGTAGTREVTKAVVAAARNQELGADGN